GKKLPTEAEFSQEVLNQLNAVGPTVLRAECEETWGKIQRFFLHLINEERTLPPPFLEPYKYERRVFALGLAYEFIVVHGSAYNLDLQRQYSLAGATHHTTADWRIIPLLSAVLPSDEAPQPANPNKTHIVGGWEQVGNNAEVRGMRAKDAVCP